MRVPKYSEQGGERELPNQRLTPLSPWAVSQLAAPYRVMAEGGEQTARQGSQLFSALAEEAKFDSRLNVDKDTEQLKIDISEGLVELKDATTPEAFMNPSPDTPTYVEQVQEMYNEKLGAINDDGSHKYKMEGIRWSWTSDYEAKLWDTAKERLRTQVVTGAVQYEAGLRTEAKLLKLGQWRDTMLTNVFNGDTTISEAMNSMDTQRALTTVPADKMMPWTMETKSMVVQHFFAGLVGRDPFDAYAILDKNSIDSEDLQVGDKTSEKYVDSQYLTGQDISRFKTAALRAINQEITQDKQQMTQTVTTHLQQRRQGQPGDPRLAVFPSGFNHKLFIEKFGLEQPQFPFEKHFNWRYLRYTGKDIPQTQFQTFPADSPAVRWVRAQFPRLEELLHLGLKTPEEFEQEAWAWLKPLLQGELTGELITQGDVHTTQKARIAFLRDLHILERGSFKPGATPALTGKQQQQQGITLVQIPEGPMTFGSPAPGQIALTTLTAADFADEEQNAIPTLMRILSSDEIADATSTAIAAVTADYKLQRTDFAEWARRKHPSVNEAEWQERIAQIQQLGIEHGYPNTSGLTNYELAEKTAQVRSLIMSGLDPNASARWLDELKKDVGPGNVENVVAAMMALPPEQGGLSREMRFAPFFANTYAAPVIIQAIRASETDLRAKIPAAQLVEFDTKMLALEPISDAMFGSLSERSDDEKAFKRLLRKAVLVRMSSGIYDEPVSLEAAITSVENMITADNNGIGPMTVVSAPNHTWYLTEKHIEDHNLAGAPPHWMDFLSRKGPGEYIAATLNGAMALPWNEAGISWVSFEDKKVTYPMGVFSAIAQLRTTYTDDEERERPIGKDPTTGKDIPPVIEFLGSARPYIQDHPELRRQRFYESLQENGRWVINDTGDGLIFMVPSDVPPSELASGTHTAGTMIPVQVSVTDEDGNLRTGVDAEILEMKFKDWNKLNLIIGHAADSWSIFGPPSPPVPIKDLGMTPGR